MSVLKAQEEVFKTRHDLTKARYGYNKNRMRFLQAIGTIGEESLEEVDGCLEQKEKIVSGNKVKNTQP
jgi:outer membrane protein TolC